MPRIYSTAETVIVWLGEASDGSDDILNLARDSSDNVGSSSAPDPEYIEQVSRFFERPYWNRTWVIQELFMARHLVFQCGGVQIDEKSFRRFLQDIPQVCQTAGRADKVVLLATQRIPGESAEYVGTRSLAQLLTEYWSTDCTDVRDKVYALLGLLPKYDARRSIEVDYAVTETQLFLRVLDCLDVFTDSSAGPEALARALGLKWSTILEAMDADVWKNGFPQNLASIRVVARGHPLPETPDHQSEDGGGVQMYFSTIQSEHAAYEQMWKTACLLEDRDYCYASEDRKFAFLFRQQPYRLQCIAAAWAPIMDYDGSPGDLEDIHSLQQYLTDRDNFSLVKVETAKTSEQIDRLMSISYRLLAVIHAYTTMRERGGALYLGCEP